MAGAPYHYNPSRAYVRAVEEYASMMRSEPGRTTTISTGKVLYQSTGCLPIRPVGYPKLRPVPVS
jgi:hypothetical protein